MKKINIVFCVDSNYLPRSYVTINSLLMHNQNIISEIFIISDNTNIKKHNLVKKYFLDRFNCVITFLHVDLAFFKQFNLTLHFSPAVYYKLVIANLLPERIDNVLYLDADIIITGSISELLNYTLTSTYLYAVNHSDYSGKDLDKVSKFGVTFKRYFNSGVMLLNLKKIRTDNAVNKMLALAQKHHMNLIYADQDILNICFYENWELLPYKFNSFISQKHSELPIIIHYICNPKPWHIDNNHPYRNIYLYYKKVTPFQPLFSDNLLRGLINRYILFKLSKIIPKPIKSKLKQIIRKD